MTQSDSGRGRSSNDNNGDNANATLQSKIQRLLLSLYETTEIIKKWPDSPSDETHKETTSELIESMHEIVRSLKRVEDETIRLGGKGNVNGKNEASKGDNNNHGNSEDKNTDLTRWKNLMQSPVPLDLIDLMDHRNGLNPDYFTRGLVREALRQMAVLRRRKSALQMLGESVKEGLKIRDDTDAAAKEIALNVKQGKDSDVTTGKEDDCVADSSETEKDTCAKKTKRSHDEMTSDDDKSTEELKNQQSKRRIL